MAGTFQAARPGERMLKVEEAQSRVLDEVRVLDVESVGIKEALGRVLREDIVSPRDVPRADNSAMDGYAVRSVDVPGALQVIEDLPAGLVARKRLEPGTAIRIMTGAEIPEGADCVAPVEITDAGSERVNVAKAVKPGANIRRRGEDMRAGAVVLESGTPLGAAEIGVLASVQKSVVSVGRRPVVSVISTGDEIVEIDADLTPGKVVNSNSYSLSSLVREAGAIPRTPGIVPDTRDATIAAIEAAAADSDFIISSGGVSVGAFDFVKEALDALGAETKFWQVAMKPGKPVVLSRLGEKLYFGLPGNPVSCMVSFLLFVAPSIRKAMGQRENLFPRTVKMRVDETLTSRGDRRAYLRVRVTARDGELVASPMRAQGSGVSTSMVGANGFAIVEEGVTAIPANSIVRVVLFGKVN